MGIYPQRRTSAHEIRPDGGEGWVEWETQPGLTRSRIVHAGPWFESRTDCFCCSCGDREGSDVFCRNHGFAGERPCESHGMPGSPDDAGEMPASVQAERLRRGPV